MDDGATLLTEKSIKATSNRFRNIRVFVLSCNQSARVQIICGIIKWFKFWMVSAFNDTYGQGLGTKYH